MYIVGGVASALALTFVAFTGRVTEALNITSKADLDNAIADGEAHVVLTEHLDLREAASFLFGVSEGGEKIGLGVLSATSLLRSIRGDCNRPTVYDIAVPPLQPLRQGQCLIITAGPLLRTTEPAHTISVWIDNVYLRIERDASHIAEASYAPMFGLIGTQRVWLTRSTVQGDKVRGGDFTAISLIAGAGMYVKDVLITDITLRGRSDAVHAVDSTFSAHNCTFKNFNVAGTPAGNLLYLEGEAAAMVIGRDVHFADVNVVSKIVRMNERAVVYGSSNIEAKAEYLNGALEPLEPVENAPEGLFLDMQGDMDFEFLAEGAPQISSDEGVPFPQLWTRTETAHERHHSPAAGYSAARAEIGHVRVTDFPGSATSIVVIDIAAVAAILVYAACRRRKSPERGWKRHVGGTASLPHPSSAQSAWSTSPRMNNSTAKSATGHAVVMMQEAGGSQVAAHAHEIRMRTIVKSPVTGKPSPHSRNVGQQQQECRGKANVVEPGISLRATTAPRSVCIPMTGTGQALKDTTEIWRSPKPVLPGNTPFVSMTSIDLGTAALATRPGVPPLDDATALELSLDRAHRAGRPVLGPYLPLGGAERCCGGQGCVQFVRDVATQKDYAVKFFLQREAFEREVELYRQEGLNATMPTTVKICKNEDGAYVGPDGFLFPPFIIIERGESLVEWQRRWQGDFEVATALQALIHIAKRLKEMHEAGWVHMDLKPNNVLWLPQQHAWSLIDFGCTAPAGTEAPLAFTPAYAAPEIVAAYEGQQPTILVDPSADIWSFGLIAYEMLTDSHVFKPGTPRADVVDALMGRTALPWEAAEESTASTRLAKLRAFRSSVMQCLSRKAAQRPSISTLLTAWYRVFDAHTTTMVV